MQNAETRPAFVRRPEVDGYQLTPRDRGGYFVSITTRPSQSSVGGVRW